MAPTDLHTPTSHESVRTAPQIYRQYKRRNTFFEEIKEEVQAGQDQATHEAPEPAVQTPVVPVGDPSTNENVPPPTLLVQATVPTGIAEIKEGASGAH